MEVDELKRFRQAVRSGIRQYVKRNREAPPTLLFASARGSCRKIVLVRVGAALDAGGVAVNIREGIIDNRSRWAAVGKLLHARQPQGGRPQRISTYGLVVVAADGRRETWEVPIVAGSVGAWTPGTFDAGSLGDLMARALADTGAAS